MAKTEKLKFSPSSSKRWMNCPGALRLCLQFPSPESSEYAMEGTAAHELASNCLANNQDAHEWVGEPIEVEDRIFPVTEEMAENVQVYLDAVRTDMLEEGISSQELSVEKKFTVKGLPVAGTNDASFSAPIGALYVYDLKYGKGMYVEVENNPQLKIYALGAWEEAGGVNDIIHIKIAQPRYAQADPVRSQTLTREELIDFKAELELAVKACKNPKAKCCPGEWCKWCPAFGLCPAVSEKAVAVAMPSLDITFPEPSQMTPENISKVMELSGLISEWAKAVHGYAEKTAIDTGVVYPGYKLIQKKGRRAWVDEIAVENEFEHEFGEVIYDKKVKSPAQLEKIVGKDRVGKLTAVPDGKIALVSEGAKGEPVGGNNVFNVIE
uniref:PD-(D/E)XK nuclease superfamily protein n=1 Tax=viral metagenome TaxID=1070528 RepID=A0A6H1ZXJ4_9ZZZZ